MLKETESGISFPDFVKGLRVRYAMSLFDGNPHISIASVADQSGFYSIRTLQRAFLAITGKSPSEYARGLKKH